MHFCTRDVRNPEDSIGLAIVKRIEATPIRELFQLRIVAGPLPFDYGLHPFPLVRVVVRVHHDRIRRAEPGLVAEKLEQMLRVHEELVVHDAD